MPAQLTSIYVAGPMRGLYRYGFPIFDRAAKALRDEGFHVVSPAELDREIGFDETSEDPLPDGFVEEAMRRDLRAILDVDAVALLPGWQTSEGVAVELAAARALGLPVYEYDDDRGCLGPLLPIEEQERRVAVAKGEPVAKADPAVDPELQRILDVSPAAPLTHGFIPGPPTHGFIPGQEVRHTSATGGEKGRKLARYHMIPADALEALAEHFGIGERKYPGDPDTGQANWQKGYPWSWSIDAHGRHVGAWLQGEDIDAETGSHHLIAGIWHLINVWWQQHHGTGVDDLWSRRVGRPGPLDDLYIDQDELERIAAVRS